MTVIPSAPPANLFDASLEPLPPAEEPRIEVPPYSPDSFTLAGACGSEWCPGPPVPPSQLAREGWHAMAGASSAYEQCSIGRSYTERIYYAAMSPAEKALAGTALSASYALENPLSTVDLFYLSFGAISAGLQGPAAAVLARTGRDALMKARGPRDQCHMGLAFCDAVKKNTADSAGAALINTAFEAYGSLEHAGSAASLLERALSAFTPWGIGGPVEAVLGKTGCEAMGGAKHNRDRCKIGYVFTRSIRDTTVHEGEKAAAQAALDAYGLAPDASSAAEALQQYLQKFAGLPPFPSGALLSGLQE
ncbi:MAG: hypothetical protein RDV48_24045 [Candidatus Eremiobacteraeota bacterium]|nr:hypothetical protein [Candidatus Eremiobacteraeota bacterium]